MIHSEQMTATSFGGNMNGTKAKMLNNVNNYFGLI